MVVASRAHEEPWKTAGKLAQGNPHIDQAKENPALGPPKRHEGWLPKFGNESRPRRKIKVAMLM